MKRTVTIAIVLSFLCFFHSSHAQGDDLIGIWKIDFEETLSLLDEYESARYDSLGTNSKNAMEQNLSSQEFQFEENGSFKGISSQGALEGTWEKTGINLRITMNASGNSITHKIISINPTEMVLQVVPNSNQSAYIHKVFLTKN